MWMYQLFLCINVSHTLLLCMLFHSRTRGHCTRSLQVEAYLTKYVHESGNKLMKHPVNHNVGLWCTNLSQNQQIRNFKLCMVLCLKVSNESITWTELFLQVVPIASSGVCPPHHNTKLWIPHSVSTGMLWDSVAHCGLQFWTSKFV